MQGWTLAGCMAVDAGPSAGLYIGKVTEGLDDDDDMVSWSASGWS
jgi:hypothetical protein